MVLFRFQTCLQSQGSIVGKIADTIATIVPTIRFSKKKKKVFLENTEFKEERKQETLLFFDILLHLEEKSAMLWTIRIISYFPLSMLFFIFFFHFILLHFIGLNAWVRCLCGLV